MGALRAEQWHYDEQLPPAVSESADEEAVRIWIDNGVAELLARRDYLFPLKGKQVGVTFDRLALAVDEHAMCELSGSGSNTVLGRLLLDTTIGTQGDAKISAIEILAVREPAKLFEQLARDLLEPFAKEGVLAQAEAEI
jgi:hypothetical protein